MIHGPLLIMMDHEGDVGNTYLAKLGSMYMRIDRSVMFLLFLVCDIPCSHFWRVTG